MYDEARRNHIDKFFSPLGTAYTAQERLKDHPDIIGQRKLTTEFQIYNKMVYSTLKGGGYQRRPTNRRPYKKLLIKTFK